jgi:hypothetical protein
MTAINAAAKIRRRHNQTETLPGRHPPGSTLDWDSEPCGLHPHAVRCGHSARLAVVSQGKTDPYEEVSNRGKTSAENLKVQR